jgi:hypothetical protein
VSLATLNDEGSMKLIVTGKLNGQAVSFQQNSADAALQKAQKLQGEGLDEIHITDITGRTYGLGEFAACFVHSGS